MPEHATQPDRPAITAFLEAQLPVSFYPLANLIHHGMGADHPKAMRFWLWRDANGLTDVLAVTGAGFLYPVFTTDVAAQAAAVLAGRVTSGLGGAPDQVSALRTTLGITAQPRLDFTEPVYRLALDDLLMPDTGSLRLHPLRAAPSDMVASWRAMFLMETQGNAADVAVHRALHELDEIGKRDTYRVLMDGNRPVAMTGFNAAFAQAVQVGGVFVPADLRGRGYGRIAVALHLRQARAAGVPLAYLCAATAPAAQAYEALGFVPHGRYAAVVYEKEQRIIG